MDKNNSGVYAIDTLMQDNQNQFIYKGSLAQDIFIPLGKSAECSRVGLNWVMPITCCAE